MAEAAANPKAALVPLRANRNFRMLWIGQVLSDLGSQIGTLAYPLLVLALTHSVVIAGAVGTVASAAAFAVRLPAGALADRLDRRRTMMACDAVRAVALAALAALVALGALAWPIVMVVAVVDRAGDTLFTPAPTVARWEIEKGARPLVDGSALADKSLVHRRVDGRAPADRRQRAAGGGVGGDGGSAVRGESRRPCARRLPVRPRPDRALRRRRGLVRHLLPDDEPHRRSVRSVG